MRFFDGFLLNTILLLFPLFIYLIYVIYQKIINKEMLYQTFTIALFLSLILMARYGYFYDNYYITVLFNIPLLFAYLKGRKILAMIGGFHLMGSQGPDSMRESEQEVRMLAARLRDMQVEKIYTGHCTGTKAFPILKEELGDMLDILVTGKMIEL